mgnify:CR=1 FL=1
MRCYLLILAIVASSTFSYAGFLFKGKKKDVDLTPTASKEVIKEAPKWYDNPPSKKGMRYQKATATSRDAQTAIDKARLSAVSTMSALIRSEANQIIDRTITESGLGDDSQYTDHFKNIMEQITGNLIEDLIEVESVVKIMKKDDIYRAYYLLGQDEASANNKIIAQLQADKKLYEQIQSSELIKEMEEKVEEYRARYNN